MDYSVVEVNEDKIKDYDIQPIHLSCAPDIKNGDQVYIIQHPRGGSLAFSSSESIVKCVCVLGACVLGACVLSVCVLSVCVLSVCVCVCVCVCVRVCVCVCVYTMHACAQLYSHCD